MITTERIAAILEGAIFAVGTPVSLERLEQIFSVEDRPTRAVLREILEILAKNCVGRGVELVEVATGWRYQVRQDLSPWIQRLWDERPVRYSRALLETLAIVVYRQPVTRSEIEEIRGVSVSQSILKTLLAQEWIRVVGHRAVPGHPALYATTKHFLDDFNLKKLDELPPLPEIQTDDLLSDSISSQENA